ncbi:MAG: EpsD family peptidyl-prolyl cis-trans isomerase [Proteobacteria bacterium]|nr:EpsD family peptidyl-prolyl cis-trans isomerase [Pseudomonadota bacterium]
MKLTAVSTLAIVACVGLAGCKFHLPGAKAKAPTGQVVATVDGEEITIRQLQAEMGNATFPNPQVQKQAQQRALQMIIERKILSKEAVDQKIDKSPTFAVERDRAIENLEVQLLAKKAADAVPPPSKEEVDQFISSHPDVFAHRKIFVVDQIGTGFPQNQQQLDALKPLKTLEEVETYLKSQNIRYVRAQATIDALGADPKTIETVANLPPTEVFVVPSRNGITINHVRETREQPFTGDKATTYATNYLRRQHEQEVVQRTMAGVLQKAAGKVSYNPAFKPQKPPAPGAPAAGAPAAAGGAAAPAAAGTPAAPAPPHDQ